MAKGLGLAYLLVYNLACCAGWQACCAGWLYVLAVTAKHVSGDSIDQLWDEVNPALKVVQTAACLEVLHSIVGLVKSPWQTALMQVFSRVWVVWAVMNVAPDAQTSVFTALTCASWGLVEVPRYLFYALNLLDAVPYPIFWLRYSLFAVLYPTGISGELGCMYNAAVHLKGPGEWTDFQGILAQPQGDVLLLGLILFVVVTYIPGSPKMYGHMVKTRKKQFDLHKNGGKADKAQKKK
eukprot:CAMPEP_0181344778 /NCGR_PEP_ID=MMETSP1101-20121128/32378_1 /TAXON_ID=46948 /ORGANISM="Rhodomonas abbreviata, Strain Caron Lab Isolate" /LENGTH=236 /DNA_ID=CAMNT_0023456651 /DNA_START=15 /DNA_END=725 /DNA_ORIENTATION=+